MATVSDHPAAAVSSPAKSERALPASISEAVTANDTARLCAQRMVSAFQRYQARHQSITRRAAQHFAMCDWQNSQQDLHDRDELYDSAVEQALALFEDTAGEQALDPVFWQQVRQDFAVMIDGQPDGGLRRAFFNALFRLCFDESASNLSRCGFLPINYRDTACKTIADPRRYYPCQDAVVAAANELLQGLPLEADWQNVHAAAIQLGDMINTQWLRLMSGTLLKIEVLHTVFYRFTRAHVIGRLIGDNGAIPFVLVLTNPEGGVVVDALLLGETELTQLLGRANVSFQVEMDQAADVVDCLYEMTPTLTPRQLFAALGYRAE